MEPILFNIQHFSIHDGPGIRTAIFFKGCPLRCAWCHNPEGMTADRVLSFTPSQCVGCGGCAVVCPQGAHRIADGRHRFLRDRCVGCGACADRCPTGALELIGRPYSIDALLEHVARDRAFYGRDGGVTLTGGEPFAQFEALMALLTRLKQEGYHVCIETSGYTNEENIRAAAGLTDLFLYDCKETDPARHLAYTGVSAKRILDNLSVLDKVGASVILRCPIIPDRNDRPEHMEAVARLVNAHPSVLAAELMPYHPLGLSKGRGIGREPVYNNSDFADKGAVRALADQLAAATSKPVRVN